MSCNSAALPYSGGFRGPKDHALPQTHEKLCNHYGIVADNSVKYVPPDGFYGIQIYRYPLLTPHLIDALGVSISTPSLSRLCAFGTAKQTLEVPAPPLNPISGSASVSSLVAASLSSSIFCCDLHYIYSHSNGIGGLADDNVIMTFCRIYW